ncbi:GNAT family N-acetyltransferase [Microbacterium sp. MPKO10]|uniref:GNAT family N-acetyltransferase n=1 Tax=Microbacterium sp. MPKO10 TaxID=2989818 RepID=UPI00223674FF|nr:GNAT family N-acetyltransferase [Microbacterium sp. MPKO10]MCW4457712.1 GNAT family N-acetyltransferase [Microbacterium sp. MPKO10]
MPRIRVRPASVKDAPAIARVHIQAWREAYAGLLSDSYLASLDEAERAEKWSRILSEPTSNVVVAESAGAFSGDVEPGGAVMGWASSKQLADSDAVAAREINGIYILAAHYGSGAGQLLLDAVAGNGSALLWLMDGNARAEAFYVRNGFRRDGEAYDREMGDRAVQIVRMVRSAVPRGAHPGARDARESLGLE